MRPAAGHAQCVRDASSPRDADPAVNPIGQLTDYFQVTSIPKKCMNTWRPGLLFAFGCGLRM